MLPIITMDGTAGSGKSTCAAHLAKHLNFLHINTGLMFRAVAWLLKLHQMDVNAFGWISEITENLEFRFIDGKSCYANGRMLGEAELFAADIGDYTRYVTPLPRVRAHIDKFYTDVCKHQKAVVEGRDVGHVISDAYLKFYVQADLSTRVARRVRQLRMIGDGTSGEVVCRQLVARDEVEQSRGVRPAPTALIVDTTALTLDETLALMVREHEKRIESCPSLSGRAAS
jgi:cytidylate kinase